MAWHDFITEPVRELGRRFDDGIIQPLRHTAEHVVGDFDGTWLDEQIDRAQDVIRETRHPERFAPSVTEIQPEGYHHNGQPSRIIISIDGTQQSDDDNRLSNTERLHRSFGDIGIDGKPQTAIYIDGSGTHHSGIGTLGNAATGNDIDIGVLQAYKSIGLNYGGPADDILLNGYSRGGLIITSTVGFIEKIGIIDYSNMSAAEMDAVTLQAYELYMDENLTANSPEVIAFRER